MLPQQGIGLAALRKGMLLSRQISGIIVRSPSNLQGLPISSSRAPILHDQSRMSVNTPSWKPTFVSLEDNGAGGVDCKCSLRVVSYNILAQAYVKSANFPDSPRSCLRWKNRSEAVVSCLLSLDADLLCLQELDEYETFYRAALHGNGYDSVYVKRGNGKRDGCGIFFRPTRILLLAEDVIDYNDLVPQLPPEEEEVGEQDEDRKVRASQKRGDINDVRVRLKRDCVGIIAAFRPLEQPSRVLIVANTHIFWDPVLMDVKLAQVRYLSHCVLSFRKRAIKDYEVEPLILVAGDFNSLPGDTVYNYVTSGVDKGSAMNAFEGKIDEVLVGGSSKFEEKVPAIGQPVLEGIVDCTDRFPLPLVSLYAYVDKEPPATNHTYNFVGTLDYIFLVPSKHLRPRSLLMLPNRDAPDVVRGLPNNVHPSDHLPIGSDLGIY